MSEGPGRADPAAMKQALHVYVDAFNAQDAERIIALFAPDAWIEDPVGSPPKRGRDEIAAFYRASVQRVRRIELAAPVRGSHGDAAAMAFVVHLDYGGRPCEIAVIDVMRFDRRGRVTSMQAYWGREDLRFCA
jgi:steroid delta-isomerase